MGQGWERLKDIAEKEAGEEGANEQQQKPAAAKGEEAAKEQQ